MAIGGNDSNLVWGERDFAGVGKWGRGNSDTMGETSGDSGVALTLFSFAFSCWYSIHAATSSLSALMRFAQNVTTPSVGSFSFLYSTRSCWRCVGESLGNTAMRVSGMDVCG